MIIAPALMLQPAADGFRRSARPPQSNPAPASSMIRQTGTSRPPIFLPATGTAGIKLIAGRLFQIGGQYRPAGFPAPGRKIRRASINPGAGSHPITTQRAVITQPAANLNSRPWWESYLYV